MKDPMPTTRPDQDADEYAAMMRVGQRNRRLRAFWRLFPGSPRCKLCHGPLEGPVMPLMRVIGKGRWPNNPHYCSGCFRSLMKNRAGAEIEATLLFADVRGSTHLAEQMTPGEFRALMGRFFEAASAVLIEREAIIDKFVGDEVVAIFIPAITGNHAEQAVDAGLGLLRATGHGRTGTPWLPIGVGVNTGIAYVGAVGSGENVDMTAMGDAVNVAARLGSAAGAGELLVAARTAEVARLPPHVGRQRSVDIRGRTASVEARVLDASARIAA